MSLVRALTTRRAKPEGLANIQHIGRAASQRAGKPVHRSQISSPVVLVSSSNPLSYEAPDIVGTKPIESRKVSSESSAASSHSGDESDASTLSINSNTDASSVDCSPVSSEPEPNHLSCYFKTSSSDSSARTSLDAPVIPRRVPSHSKKAHERLHRKRSVQRLMSPPSSVILRRDSTDMFRAVEAPKENPFTGELAQLDEVAEEFSHAVRDAEADADATYMTTHDLAHFGASDYLAEIHSLIYDTFLAEEPSWI
ncbi:hypothetical protein DOTSEDRAFT_71757 [Dothistroma septosporum NZE10]|uniref:Uncharacterized protein n=1 Tax=Dothistroma septosporum (strain NZE10 / CBS 128990) TaxID=675120 RepID=N1PM20_DOTSN|nr:hypothetical protein DOTSEDRAFT_71757 [Dothistroma septosporum NZE10]